jgi:hypothetical protein
MHKLRNDEWRMSNVESWKSWRSWEYDDFVSSWFRLIYHSWKKLKWRKYLPGNCGIWRKRLWKLRTPDVSRVKWFGERDCSGEVKNCISSRWMKWEWMKNPVTEQSERKRWDKVTWYCCKDIDREWLDWIEGSRFSDCSCTRPHIIWIHHHPSGITYSNL